MTGADLIGTLVPKRTERVARMRADLLQGVPVLLSAGRDRAVVMAVETLDADRLGALERLSHPLTLVLSRYRASALGLTTEPATPVLEVALDPGSSAVTLRHLADPSVAAAVLEPRAGVARPGDDIHAAAVVLTKQAGLLPAAVFARLTTEQADRLAGELAQMSVADVFAMRDEPSPHKIVSGARLPMEVSDLGEVHVFRSGDGTSEHYAVVVGAPDLRAPVLTRVHSACFTGDVLGSLKCDCGPQLRAAMAAMAEAGGGLVIYLNQEGRGIGLANKMRAYALQEAGSDTVEANNQLGFADDERDLREGAALLAHFGIRAVRLMTNNPLKIRKLAAHGIEVVERVPLVVGETDRNAGYLRTKVEKSGHLPA